MSCITSCNAQVLFLEVKLDMAVATKQVKRDLKYTQEILNMILKLMFKDKT